MSHKIFAAFVFALSLSACKSSSTDTPNGSSYSMVKYDGRATCQFVGDEVWDDTVHLEIQDRKDSLIGWYRVGPGQSDTTERSFQAGLHYDTTDLGYYIWPWNSNGVPWSLSWPTRIGKAQALSTSFKLGVPSGSQNPITHNFDTLRFRDSYSGSTSMRIEVAK